MTYDQERDYSNEFCDDEIAERFAGEGDDPYAEFEYQYETITAKF